MSDVTSVSNLATQYINEALRPSTTETGKTNNKEAFSDLLSSAMQMIKETNDLSNAANAEQMNFALGYSDNTHDLAIAQQKAALSLQYTVAVKNKVLEAYKEIMNMQI
ncbi:MAG: flagellar hook-basal body complex protein FliE [Lachnospiraceae bacterium]|nr:flagellar hook-basal body complex protein FliE [Clostridiales bacterium]MDD6294186.1 flagellar hook-basal body complex protein FliE [Eubacteriales bacterium]MDY2607721.1 flagellar hook-basal body complex protein FliE [Lachnospiraceae bacterium]